MTDRAEPIALELEGRRLTAVPSIHNGFTFAREVNALCADPATRPQAVAVELTPPVASAAWAWLQDLGVGPAATSSLPCMLGLLEPGDAPGCDATLLCLTPSDSIVEGLRSAMEAGLPAYGIDLATPSGRRTRGLMPDVSAAESCSAYVSANGAFAAHHRDPAVDEPRETVMARRLTYLLRQHERVLLVCGLAHWESLQRMLKAGTVAEAVEACDAARASPRAVRVIVHPFVALPYMDRFPKVVEAYQSSRIHAGRGPERGEAAAIDPASLYAGIVQTVDTAEFVNPSDARTTARDWDARADFGDMLVRLSAMHQRRVPTAGTVLAAAGGTMSLQYRRRLAEELLRYPWASPVDPRLASLPALVPAGASGTCDVVLVDREGRRGPEMRLQRSRGSDAGGTPAIPWGWDGDRRERGEPSDMVINWPPIDRLVTALSLRAMALAREQTAEPRVDPFEGGLDDGLAIKATLRSYARGADQVFVHSRPRRRTRVRAADEDGWEPVVWLFRLAPRTGAHWRVLAEEFDELIPHARRPDAMRRIRDERGSVLIEQVGFCTHEWGWSHRGAVRGGHSKVDWSGILIYTPTHFTLRPTARYVEDRDYRSNPIVSYANPTSDEAQRLRDGDPLIELFRRQYGMRLDLDDWPTTLIRMAVPFARASVTVVAPDLFAVARPIREEAVRRGVAVRVLQHSTFSPDALAAISGWYGSRPIAGTAGREFSKAEERRFGEPAATNANLLPACWRRYGEDPAP